MPDAAQQQRSTQDAMPTNDVVAGPAPQAKAPVVVGRIVGTSIDGNRVRLVIGFDRPVPPGKHGFVEGVADSAFVVDSVTDGFSIAFTAVAIPIDSFASHKRAIATESKAPVKDEYRYTKRPERIVGVTTENGRTRILIASGSARGVVVGMRGKLITGNQTPFVIDRVLGEATCSALLDDAVEDLPSVRYVFIFKRSEQS